MKLGKFLSMSVLSVLALGACTPNADDNSEWIDGSQPVSFISQIQGVKSRAANNAWDENGNDQVGIFVKQNGAFGDVVNKHYRVSASGALSTASASDAIYYPENGDKVDFVAYYPYTASLSNNTYAVDVADQTSQPAIDLLYSANATNKDKTVTTPVQLTFKHQLAKIVLNISTDGSVPSLAGLKVSINGTKTKGSFALLDGTLTTDANSVKEIAANVNAAGTLGEAIILPVDGLTGGEITFTLGSETKTWSIPAGQIYAGGSQYTYPVTIKKEGGQISVAFGNATIDDWTPVAFGNIDIEFGEGGDVPPTPGVEGTIIEETFGNKAGKVVSSSTKIGTFSDWDNPTLSFTPDAGNSADIRAIAHKTEANPTETTKINNLWLKAKNNSSLTISGINAEGYKNIKVIFEAGANVFNSGDEIDLNVITVKWNGTSLTLPSKIVSKAGNQTNVFYEMTATSELSGTANSTLEFSADADANLYGLRVANIKLLGTK